MHVSKSGFDLIESNYNCKSIFKEKCETKYETQYDTECHTEYRTEYETVYEEKCEQKYVDKVKSKDLRPQNKTK